MSFGAEMKDFAAGFSTGFSLRDKAKDRKQREDIFNAKERGVTTDDLSTYNKDKEHFGEGASTGAGTPREPSATGGGAAPKEAGAAGKERYDYLVGLGVPPNLASGMVGNAYAESRFDTGAYGDRNRPGGSRGEFQWDATRYAGMQNYAKQNNLDPNDWKTQYQYAWKETQALPAFKKMLAAADPTQAADLFALHFERPAGAQTGDPNKIHNISGRRSYAQGFSYGMPDASSGAVASAWGKDQPVKVASAGPTTALPVTAGQTAVAPEAAPAQEVAQVPVTWDIGDEEEDPTQGYADGGPVKQPGMRVFTQGVAGDAAPGATAIPQPRQIDFAAARAPVANPSAGVQQAFRDRMAASRARLATPAAAPAAAAAAPNPTDQESYLAAARQYRAGQQAGLQKLELGRQMNLSKDEIQAGGQRRDSYTNGQYNQPFMSYEQWAHNQRQWTPGGVNGIPYTPAAEVPVSGLDNGAGVLSADPYAERRRQITAASRASQGFAEGGAVKKDDPQEAIPTGQLVSGKDYGRLSPGGAPVREGTAALWRLDAQAQTRAKERLQKRDKEYHQPSTGGAPGGGGGAGGGGDKTTRAAPVRKRKEPDDATGSTDPQTESAVEAYPGSKAPEVTPQTATEAYPGSRPPEQQAIPVKPQDAPQVDPRPQAPATLARGTVQEVQVFNPHTGQTETRQQPTSPAATPATAPPEYGPGGPGGYTPAAPDNRQPPAAIDRAGNPTGAAPRAALPPPPAPIPPSLPLPNASGAPSPGSAPPVQTSGPSPAVGQVAQAIPAGPATPSPQPPVVHNPVNPSMQAAPTTIRPPSAEPTPPVAKAIQGPPGAAAQADVAPEPWIPGNVPEEAKGTLSQAWQYGRALLNADPDKRPAAESLFNDTLLRAMKLGTPHSVISAYADNFGVAAPARPRKAIGFAEGGAVPDEEEYTPANQQAAAADQPIVPEGSGNLRAATPEAEATAKGKPIVTREEVKESTKAGLKYINDNILSPKRTTAVGQDPAQGGAQQAFDTNSHALTTQEVQQVTQQVDPENKLSQSQKILKAQSDMYDWYMAHGYPEKAAGAAASVMMYGRRVSQVSGNMAQAALESGRPDALVQASKFMAKAYENMPNGHELKVEPQPGADGKLGYEIIDENNNTVEQGRAGPDEMMTMAKRMSNGQAWAAETFRLAQETGMDDAGAGRGRSKSTGPTYTERSTEERKGLSKAAAEAGKAFKADPSDENRQKYEDAKAAAISGGVSGGAMTSLDKIYSPAAAKPPGTAGERADLEADQALEAKTGELDKQIGAETDPAKQLELKKQRALLPLDDGYNRAVKKARNRVDSKGLDEELDRLEIADGPDRDAVSRFAKDLQRGNNLAIGDAAQAVKMALDPNETFRINGNQVMIGDQSYFLSGPLYRGLMGIRNAKKKTAAPAAAPAAEPTAAPATAATG